MMWFLKFFSPYSVLKHQFKGEWNVHSVTLKRWADADYFPLFYALEISAQQWGKAVDRNDGSL